MSTCREVSLEIGSSEIRLSAKSNLSAEFLLSRRNEWRSRLRRTSEFVMVMLEKYCRVRGELFFSYGKTARLVHHLVTLPKKDVRLCQGRYVKRGKSRSRLLSPFARSIFSSLESVAHESEASRRGIYLRTNDDLTEVKVPPIRLDSSKERVRAEERPGTKRCAAPFGIRALGSNSAPVRCHDLGRRSLFPPSLSLSSDKDACKPSIDAYA